MDQVVNRDNDITLQEVIDEQFLKITSQNTLFWSPWEYSHQNLPFNIFWDLVNDKKDITINSETDGKIRDGHFGDKGMKVVGEWMIKNLNKFI